MRHQRSNCRAYREGVLAFMAGEREKVMYVFHV
jgi:hypothetical protein